MSMEDGYAGGYLRELAGNVVGSFATSMAKQAGEIVACEVANERKRRQKQREDEAARESAEGAAPEEPWWLDGGR